MKLESRLPLPCSGCVGQATFTTEGDHPTFSHTMPCCERFNKVNTIAELIEYMHECAAKRDQKARGPS